MSQFDRYFSRIRNINGIRIFYKLLQFVTHTITKSSLNSSLLRQLLYILISLLRYMQNFLYNFHFEDRRKYAKNIAARGTRIYISQLLRPVSSNHLDDDRPISFSLHFCPLLHVRIFHLRESTKRLWGTTRIIIIKKPTVNSQWSVFSRRYLWIRY